MPTDPIPEAQTKWQHLRQTLSQGADERIFLRDDGTIKYGISLTDTGVVNRGSCTANPLNHEDLTYLQQLQGEHKTTTEWADVLETCTQGIQREIHGPGDPAFEVFYAPSGTDLMYYPLLFGRLLHPDKPLLNVVTCLEELGSGTKLSSRGKYFSAYSQFGEALPTGEDIIDASNLETVFYQARSEQGEILTHDQAILALVQAHPQHLIIVNLVYGSKSGIQDNLELIDKIDAPNVIWNVDLCQFRHRRSIVNRLIGKGALVMITGSKFYQAPPFCGALLVPQGLYRQLDQLANWEAARPFQKIFSQYDFPKPLRRHLSFLSGQINVAGILRWSVAVREMKRYLGIDREKRMEKVRAWNQTIIREMDRLEGFELIPDHKQTNKSIISFRLRKGAAYLSHEALKRFHYELVSQHYGQQYTFDRIFIGQPVAYTNSSFLRLSIGAKNVRQFVADDEREFARDREILYIIADKLKHFENA